MPAIVESRPLRLGLILLLYIAQGVPLGLFYIAIPAWLSASGASAAEVGAFLSATSLPWALKFVNGFVMERFAFLPMGRRRAWLIGSQAMIVLGLLAIAALQPGARDIALLSALSFCVNVATTFQDVAVDGMAVDLVPDAERGLVNSLMFGGQMLGMAGAGAAAGFGIALVGIGGVAALAALFVALMVLLLLMCRERPGERLLPWSRGRASPETEAVQLHAWWPILKSVWAGMMRGPSLLLLPALLLNGATAGTYSALAPLAGTRAAGWPADQVSGLMASGSLVAGALAVTLFGLVLVKTGPRYGGALAYGAQVALGLFLALSLSSWAEGWPLRSFILSFDSSVTLLSAGLGALAMRRCSPAVAATQFGLYMAVANLGRTIASALVGPLEALGGLVMLPLFLAACAAAGAILLLTSRGLDSEQAGPP